MLFEICLLSNWLVFFQTCDIWDLPSSKWNGFCQYFMVLIRNCSVHSWHLNFSPQIASVQTLKWPSAIASRPFESLHWCNFGEKFKCHSCDETISIRIILRRKRPSISISLVHQIINLLHSVYWSILHIRFIWLPEFHNNLTLLSIKLKFTSFQKKRPFSVGILLIFYS